MIKVKRALISVSNKKGLIPFAKELHSLGIKILSTGGTARQLLKAGIPAQEVSEHTGFPEILDGRVKTLHPKIHGGLLALRNNAKHMAQMEEHNIGLIDMVVVNLYPFESVVKKKNVALEEAIENIDIGGPSMLRSAAKNFKSVAVISNPDKYNSILNELRCNNCLLSDSVLFGLSVEAFQHTAQYDTIIADFLKKRISKEGFDKMPREIDLKFSKAQDLRYGENPHQDAAFYREKNTNTGLADIKQLHGKELSFNNFLDLNAAIDFIKDFTKPAAVIIKHSNPTGIAEDSVLSKAYKKAWSCDPISAFGGIIGLNKKVDEKTAILIYKSGFMECIIAPKFSSKALKILTQKKNIRVIEFSFESLVLSEYDFRKVYGGLLLQQKDEKQLKLSELKVATQKKPTKSQIEDCLFGWKVIKNIKSNAIILVKGKKTLGIGCGQTSRVESVKIAIDKAGKAAKNAILISDAFIPKVDNITLADYAGIKTIVHTGGSIADDDVIKAADKAKIAILMTGIRHFKH